MQKILFPTDFSEAANHAFSYALRVADAIKASIIVFHAYEIPAVGRALPHTLAEFYESIKLEEFKNYEDHIPVLEQIGKDLDLSHISVQYVLEGGHPKSAIIRQAKKERADLIVMGTTGSSGLREVFIGSIAGEIMENAPCPVLAIPQQATFDGAFDAIAFATDYKGEHKEAIHWLMDWAKQFDTTLHIFHVDTSHTEDIAPKMPRFSESFKKYNNLIFSVVDANYVEEGISQFVQEHKIDMLAMVIHQRSPLREFFTYSFTKQMSYHLQTPIISIPADMVN